MKRLIIPTLIIAFLFSCSSDNAEEKEKEKGTVHLSSRINSDSYNDEKVDFEINFIEDLGDVLRIRLKNNDNDSFTVNLPDPIEQVQYTIVSYKNSESNVSSVILSGDGIYLSKDGSLKIDSITTNGDCEIYKGSLSINYRRQDNSPGSINIQGTFEIPTERCD